MQRHQVGTPRRLARAPGFIARRGYQAYVDLWQARVTELTGPQFAVLTVLDEHPGTDQASVAAAADIDPSTMADMARRLERRHLVVRVTSLTDRRVKLLQLTQLGQDTLREAREQADMLHRELFSSFEQSRVEELRSALAEIANAWTDLAESRFEQTGGHDAHDSRIATEATRRG